jgi:hypothetical protein
MRDFTLPCYSSLLSALSAAAYKITPLPSGISAEPRSLILRHDIDARPARALAMARLEHAAGISSAYFFKTRPPVFVPSLIKEIAALGHVVGYHYEDLVRHHGNGERAIAGFAQNLERLRQVVPVTAICADGNPLSRYSNLWLWEKYDYRQFGITHEMYLDIDYDHYAYYTDTGRRWNGDRYNVWDHVKSTRSWPQYRSTGDIIRAVETKEFPAHAALSVHPQRWNDNPVAWARELVWQGVKNRVKGVTVAKNVTNVTRDA